MVMSAEEFASAFTAENDYVERKRGTGAREIQRAIVALSNSDGGVILIGVDDQGRVIGHPASAGTEDAVHEAALAVHDPGRYWIHELLVDRVAVTVVAVERRSQGFAQTSDGQVLVRRGARSTPLIGGELQRFISERALARFDSTDAGVTIDAVDDELLDRIRQAYGWRSPAEPDLLQGAGLAIAVGQDTHLTVAGSLTLLRVPHERLGKAFIEILRYPGEGDSYDRREEIVGPAEDQVVLASRFVMEELGTDVVVSGLRRYELPRLPEEVLREAIANAVAHRSYEEVGRSIRIELRPDRVVILSPGGLPEPVTEQNIRDAQSARNTTVLEVLRRLRLAEDLGRGVDVIQDKMAEALLDPPTFEDLDGHSVRVVLPIRGAVTPQERAWVQEVERQGAIQPRDRLLLIQAARGEELTNARVRELLTVDSRDARQALQRLRDAGFVEQVGRRGGTTYVLSGSLKAPASFRMRLDDLKALVIRLAETGPVTNARVRGETGLDRAETLRILDALVREGRLVRTGERRGAKYDLPDPGRAL
jgi:ATP-dependent DNA helicase RecG